MMRDSPLVGIQFLELFQLTLVVQKAATETLIVAFLATSDERIAMDALKTCLPVNQPVGY
ncbi:MAG: hypothetical protein DMG57_24885 [Acidobacteria bacterium]|nr:MAG: hypothetical protein DMG57_24885 [Acidobacteriota bacterium]